MNLRLVAWSGDDLALVWQTDTPEMTTHLGGPETDVAALVVVEPAGAGRRHPLLHAFPSVDHPASNAVCRKAGFTLVGECGFECPKGHVMRCHDWRVHL